LRDNLRSILEAREGHEMQTHLQHVLSRRLLFAAAALSLIPRLLLAAPDLELAMSVDVPVPGVAQPVQFTVALSNVGADAATAVVVTDKLPVGLAIPAGMAAFTSVGSYDPATGTWTVGDLSASGSAMLVIPAIVTAAPQPPCLVNIADTSNSSDKNTANDRAVAAIRQSAADRCVDVAISGGGNLLPACEKSRHLELSVVVDNAGPDTATNLLVDLSQSPALAPNLHFTGAGCSGTRCTIATLAAGASLTLQALSNDFQNKTEQTLTLGFSVSSGETDYATTNNQASASGPVPVFDTCDIDVGKSTVSCFIATAAYGSALEPHVVALRQFRDRYLQQSAIGRAFIRFYYRHSPPLADLIRAHPTLRFATRMMLTPLVLAIVYPLRTLMMLLAAVFVLGWHLRPGRVA
jgi:uncharacterized repeat protein (TIGR01451 family)